jgi:hypothetical protein
MKHSALEKNFIVVLTEVRPWLKLYGPISSINTKSGFFSLKYIFLNIFAKKQQNIFSEEN